MSTDATPLPDDVVLCHQIIRELQREFAELKGEVAQLKTRLNHNSSNSSKPPSSDPLVVKRAPPKRATGKKRGGQRGHKRHRRELVPPEKVTASLDIKPETYRCCNAALLGDDPEHLRDQVAELPPIEPVVTEFRLHRLTCEECGKKTCCQLLAGVPRSASACRLC